MVAGYVYMRKKIDIIKPLTYYEATMLMIYGALYFSNEHRIDFMEFHVICWKSSFALIPILSSLFMAYVVFHLQSGPYLMHSDLQEKLRGKLTEMLTNPESNAELSMFINYPGLPDFSITIHRDQNVIIIYFERSVKGYSQEFDKFVESRHWGVGSIDNVKGIIHHL